MIAIAEAIIERWSTFFDPASRRDCYQDAPCELVMRRQKGWATAPRAIAAPPKVINLTESFKCNLGQDAEPEPKAAAATKSRRAKSLPDWSQRALLLSVSGGRELLAMVDYTTLCKYCSARPFCYVSACDLMDIWPR